MSSTNEEMEEIKKHKKLRGVAKANLTKKGNELRQLMTSEVSPDIITAVKDKQLGYKQALEEFKTVHEQYYGLLNDEDDKEEADAYGLAVETRGKALIDDVTSWVSQQEEKPPSLKLGDSASQVSATSSARARAAARRAALQAKAATLEQHQKLQLEELKLKQKREELDLLTEVAMATAEEEAYNGAPPEEPNSKPQASQPISGQLNPSAQEFKSSNNITVTSPNPAAHSENTSNEQDAQAQHQQQLLEALHLPKAELMIYEGDPLQFWVFMRAFENSVANSSLSDGAKLTRLLQYCRGPAGRVIQHCTVMDPKDGYSKAICLLKERFGSNYIIADAWINKVTSKGAIAAHDKHGIREFADDLKNCYQTLEAMGHLKEVNTQKVIVSIAECLPGFVRNRWVREVRLIRRKNDRVPSFVDLVEFVQDVVNEICDPVYGRLSFSRKEGNYNSSKSGPARPRNKGSSFTTNVVAQEKCLKCKKESHTLFECNEFKGMGAGDRFSFARDNRLCFNCLKVGHRSDKCRLDRVCSVEGCGRKHTKFLHLPKKSQGGINVNEGISTGATAVTETEQSQSGFVGASVEGSGKADGAGGRRVVLPIVSVLVYTKGKDQAVPTFALLDTGSTSSFCTEALVKQLGISGKPQTLSLDTLDSSSSVVDSSVVSLEVEGVNGTHGVNMPTVFTCRNIPIREENIVKQEDIVKWSHLAGLDFPQVEGPRVGLLIGQDIPEALMPLEVRRGQRDEPYAIRTNLGWAMSGPVGVSQGCCATVHFVSSSEELQVEKFWEMDSNKWLLDETKGLSVNDRKVLSIWEDTISHVDGHYQMAIPFKERPPELANNREMAESRLQSLGRRLKRDPNLYQKYCSGMKENIEKGYAHLVSDKDLMGSEGRTWYLPHQPVVNPLKPEKLRIVFDCAATFRGESLNSHVLQGPDLTNNLLGVLLRFRENRVALMGDVETMFHQVRVVPEDQDALRFLWWPGGDVSREPKVYKMGVHLFGGAWSPSCCTFALQRTAEDNSHDFSKETIETVQRNFYVDDCLKSLDTEAQAIQLCEELTTLLERGGFNITKWCSSSKRVVDHIPEEARAKSVKGLDFNGEAGPLERALGVYWDIGEDVFGFKFHNKDRPLTRRGLLGTISSIYDPLGLASPFTIRAKGIMQNLCRMGLGWDDPIPEEELKGWSNWVKELPKLGLLKIDRCLKPLCYDECSQYEVHHFCDASEKAYGCVSYLRTIDSDGQVYCNILMAKSHVAPLKCMSIPRLELSAAVLAAKVDTMIRRELGIQLQNSVFWTDSTIVLQYICNTEKRFKTFVSNRIAVIHHASHPAQWRHVPSELNIADVVSRGLAAQELTNSKTWFKGPEFLSLSPESWPKQPELGKLDSDSCTEVRASKPYVQSYVASVEENVFDRLLNRRSDWHRLKVDIAWLLRFIKFLAAKVTGQGPVFAGPTITVEELELSETAILRYVQSQSVCRDKANGASKAGSIHKLDPRVSDTGVLVVGGRLRNAPLQYYAKHPAILPGKSHVVTLIVRKTHEESGHAGREHVLALLREHYWVIGARQVVRRVLGKCVVCKRMSAAPAKQKMADLPEDRVVPDLPPFTHVGVDYFGPFLVKRGRSVEKRYGCLFTCLCLRAIHIEIVHTLDVDSFICALQRFMARRGKPQVLRSDNGTNFVGAERQLRDIIASWNQNTVHSFLQQRMITWKFNAPRASHMGGVWERMIKMTRKVLSSIMKEQVLADERLSTLICLVESIVNSRPLTNISDDARDPEPLTPNHLLLLRKGTAFPLDVFDKKDLYCKRKWRQVQYLAGVFWKRWLREYLPLLQARHKWGQAVRNFHVGDIVLLVDSDIPRNKWVMGRIVETLPGRDGLVRTVKVKVQDNVLCRPIAKLCLLEAIQQAELVEQ